MIIPIEKIISGGQTGADIAALDAAIDYGVPHGGWISKGRRTESGPLPDRYLLKETNNIGYPQRTTLNILDSDGTLLFSHGELTGRSALTQELAKKHSRPCLHINLGEISEYQAVEIIRDWIEVKGIKVLNVSGSTHSEDPFIYDAVNNILKSVLYPPPEQFPRPYPRTVHKAVDRLVSVLSFKEKTRIAHMAKEALSVLSATVGQYIRDHFGLGWGNEELMASCRAASETETLNEENASMVIIEALWEELRHTHGLKLLK
ncbi:MAG: putative molybdenum carrier protein [Deltaproteobacteria bacterium]|nr:putative molybdenum carrier protein [Deltaproteobacteria bacterium]